MKELASLRTEIRANNQISEVYDYKAETIHCFRDSNGEEWHWKTLWITHVS